MHVLPRCDGEMTRRRHGTEASLATGSGERQQYARCYGRSLDRLRHRLEWKGFK
jgi:hypothetical protein